MDDKNLFNRQSGEGIRDRISNAQRSTVLLDAPMSAETELERYSGYQYTEPGDKKIETDVPEKLESNEDSGFSSSNGTEEKESNKESKSLKDRFNEARNYDPFKEKKQKNAGSKGFTPVSKKMPNAENRVKDSVLMRDMIFSFLNGRIDTVLGSKQGDLQRNNLDLKNKQIGRAHV